MFTTILKHELTYWSKNPLPYIFGIFLFLITFISIWGMSAEGTSGSNVVIVNSAYKIIKNTNFMSLLMIFMLPAIIGTSIFRDFKSKIYAFLYSYPFSKKDYLSAKFLSAFIIVTILISLLGLGYTLATMMPYTNNALLISNNLLTYVKLYFVFLIPNMLFFSLFVFAVVAFTRNIYIGFISLILFIILQSVLSGLLAGNEWNFITTLLDPTADKAIKQATQYWTIQEQNFSSFPITKTIILNRLFWFLVSLGIMFFVYAKFEFSQFSGSIKKAKKSKLTNHTNAQSKIRQINIPSVNYNFSFLNKCLTSWRLSNIDFKYIVFSLPFLAILISGFLMVLFLQYDMNPKDGVYMHPSTAEMLKMPMFFFSGVINLITFLYTGILIYRAKLSKMEGLVNITPQPNWVMMLSKLFAILKVQLLLLALVMLTGLIVQTYNGFYRFEIAHYLFELFILQFMHFSIWACLAIFIHSLFDNMYLSFFVLILIPIDILILPSAANFIGLDFMTESIFQFNTVPDQYIGFEYSDLNGYGSQLPKYFLYKSYWLLAGFLLLTSSLLFWKREYFYSFSEKISFAKIQFSKKLGAMIIISAIAFISMGATIYYQENYVAKINFSQEDQDKGYAENEKKYGHLIGKIQPKMVKANINMDIYPKTQAYKASGTLYYINKTTEPIDTIIVAKSFKENSKVNILNLHQLIAEDNDLKYHIVKLQKSLEFGDTLAMNIEIENFPNSMIFKNSRILKNGTYFNKNILPVLGARNWILSSAKKRKRYGLKPNSNNIPLSETELLGYKNINNNAGRIEYETIVSTSLDQQAFSMGVLQNKWTENDRNYFHYKSDGKIANDISWLSGTYENENKSSKHQHLELYYHKNHSQNNPHFFNGMSTSLDYCSDWFGALSYDTLKLVEFSVEQGTYATVNGNLVPYSESQFMCNVGHHKNENFNFPFHTSAHEIAHLWWGKRINPANVPGGKLITESMADYIAFKVTEHEYGYDEAFELRKTYLNLYLKARTQSKNERPLISAELHQDHLNYQKGSYQLYALSEFIGEQNLNTAFAKFEKKHRFSEPPFPASREFVNAISEACPDSLKYLIYDMFETITLYENSLENQTSNEMSNGYFETTVAFNITKYRANEAGKKSYSDNGIDSLKYNNFNSLPLNDYVQLGLYNTDNKLVTLKTIKATDIYNQKTFITDQFVHQIIIDPNLLLIDVK